MLVILAIFVVTFPVTVLPEAILRTRLSVAISSPPKSSTFKVALSLTSIILVTFDEIEEVKIRFERSASFIIPNSPSGLPLALLNMVVAMQSASESLISK